MNNVINEMILELKDDILNSGTDFESISKLSQSTVSILKKKFGANVLSDPNKKAIVDELMIETTLMVILDRDDRGSILSKIALSEHNTKRIGYRDIRNELNVLFNRGVWKWTTWKRMY